MAAADHDSPCRSVTVNVRPSGEASHFSASKGSRLHVWNGLTRTSLLWVSWVTSTVTALFETRRLNERGSARRVPVRRAARVGFAADDCRSVALSGKLASSRQIRYAVPARAAISNSVSSVRGRAVGSLLNRGANFLAGEKICVQSEITPESVPFLRSVVGRIPARPFLTWRPIQNGHCRPGHPHP